ncbi:hypothetical protein D3C72_2291660 [compost metagenome]
MAATKPKPQSTPASINSRAARFLVKGLGPNLRFVDAVDFDQLVFYFFDHAAITAHIKCGRDIFIIKFR